MSKKEEFEIYEEEELKGGRLRKRNINMLDTRKNLLIFIYAIIPSIIFILGVGTFIPFNITIIIFMFWLIGLSIWLIFRARKKPRISRFFSIAGHISSIIFVIIISLLAITPAYLSFILGYIDYQMPLAVCWTIIFQITTYAGGYIGIKVWQYVVKLFYSETP